MCPEEKCSKKVVDENNESYRCEKCNKTYNSFKWAYMVSVYVYINQKRKLIKVILGGNFRCDRCTMGYYVSK